MLHHLTEYSLDNGATWLLGIADEEAGAGKTITLAGLPHGTYQVRLRITPLSGGNLTPAISDPCTLVVGAPGIIGASAASLATIAPSGIGAIRVAGAEDVSLASIVIAAAGSGRIAGQSTQALGAITPAATGILISGAIGQASPTLADATQAATGTNRVAGQSAPTLATVTSSGAGVIRVAGQTTATLAAATNSGAGTVTGRVGASAVTLAGITQSGAGTVVDTTITDLFNNSSLNSTLWGTSNVGGSITETTNLAIATTVTTQGALVYRKQILSRGTAWAQSLKLKVNPTGVTSNSLLIALLEVPAATTPAATGAGTILGQWVIGATPKPGGNWSILNRQAGPGAFQWVNSSNAWSTSNMEFTPAALPAMVIFSFDGTTITVSVKSADETSTYRSGSISMASLNAPGGDLYLAFGDMYTDDSYGTLTVSSYSGL
jgi:hypothetical protein